MRILIQTDDDFNYRECEVLYNENCRFMHNSCSFKDIVYNSHFYSFYKNDILVGCVYVVNEDGKLFLNGFSKRKNHKFNIEAVKKVLSFYNCEIYAKTVNKTAKFLLKKCGFVLIFISDEGVMFFKKEK